MWFLMKQHTGTPKNLDEYIDFSMFVQAEGLKFCTEHYLQRFPETSGALIWQLNDCWPGHSWSMVDHDLIPKASYYYSKRFYKPVILSLFEIDNTTTELWVINNTISNYDGEIKLSAKDFFGNSYLDENLNVTVKANATKMVKSLTVDGRFYKNVIVPNRNRNYYIIAKDKNGEKQAVRFFGEYKDIPLPTATIRIKSLLNENILDISISTDTYARFVKVDRDIEGLVFNDNYFDIKPLSEKKIQCQSKIKLEFERKKTICKTLNSKKQYIHV